MPQNRATIAKKETTPEVPWFALAWPLDWPAIFGREVPLVAEIGTGKGEFLVELARRNPDWNVTGIELSSQFGRATAGRVLREEVQNARVLWCEGSFALKRLYPPGSLEAVFVNHPDPWPKARHAKRRLIQPEFLRLLAARLRPGGTFELVTDHRGYADWAAQQLRGAPNFESLHGRAAWTHQIEGRIPTRYEAKARRRGEPIYYLQWRLGRTAEVAAPSSPPPGEVELPHVILAGRVEAGRIARDFEPWHERHGQAVFRFREAYLQREGREVLLETVLHEEGLEQRLFLLVRPGGGEVLVKALRGPWLRPSQGVKAAIRSAAGWLARRYPELKIEKLNA